MWQKKVRQKNAAEKSWQKNAAEKCGRKSGRKIMVENVVEKS
jgi:hypothetical protein